MLAKKTAKSNQASTHFTSVKVGSLFAAGTKNPTRWERQQAKWEIKCREIQGQREAEHEEQISAAVTEDMAVSDGDLS